MKCYKDTIRLISTERLRNNNKTAIYQAGFFLFISNRKQFKMTLKSKCYI